MNYLEVALGVIGFLLVIIGADFYRRLYKLKTRVKELEGHMTALELAQSLRGKDIDALTKAVERQTDAFESRGWPTIQQLSTDVAVLSSRLRVHMNGGTNED
jgi:hypothetical protein